jgi:hypothetical protein
MMMATQQFQLQEPVPGLPGEWVCAGCRAPMTMAEPSGDAPADAMIMDHQDGCPEVKTLTAGRA